MGISIFRHMRIFWWPFIIFNTVIATLIISPIHLVDSFYLSLSLCMSASFAYVHNDLLDSVCDAINRNNGRGHEIVYNKSKYNVALISLFLLSFAFASFIGINVVVCILIMNMLLFVYNFVQYKTPLAIVFSSVLATAPIFIPVILWQTNIHDDLWVIFFALVSLVICREIVADINDYSGDKIAGKKTLVVMFGRSVAVYFLIILSAISLLVLLLSAFYSFLHNDTSFLQIGHHLLFITSLVLITFFDKKLTKQFNGEKYIKRTRFVTLLAPFLLI